MSHPEKVERALLREGLFPLSVPECKKSRCQGGAKAPTQCLPLTYTAFFVLYSARKGGKPLYIVYMFGFFLFCLYSVVAVCVGGVPLVLSAPHPLRSPPKPPRRGGKGGALIGAQRPTTARGRKTSDRSTGERGQRKTAGEPERGGGRIGSERRAKNPPHIVARGDFFFRKRAVLAQRRGLYVGTSRGEENSERDSGAARASFSEGCGRGVRIGIWLWVSTACYGAVSAL